MQRVKLSIIFLQNIILFTQKIELVFSCTLCLRIQEIEEKGNFLFKNCNFTSIYFNFSSWVIKLINADVRILTK